MGCSSAVDDNKVDPGGNAMRRISQTSAIQSAMRWTVPDSLVAKNGRTESSRRTRSRLPSTAKALAWVGIACWLVFGSVQPCEAQPTPEKPVFNTFSEVLVQDRVWQRRLSNAADRLDKQDYLAAADLLQSCFSAPEDGFVIRPELTQPGARANAATLLRAAKPAAWEVYEQRFGNEAQQALELVERQGPPGAYHAVIRSFEHTAAGATALDRLASWHMGRGDFDSAVTCWELLFANPVHASRITAIQRLKLLFAAQRIGQSEIVQRESSRLGNAKVSLGGKSLTASEWMARLEKMPPGSAAWSAEWRLFGGSTERTRVTTGSAPFLRPSVTVSMFDPGSRTTPTVDDRSAVRDGRTQFEQDIDNAVSAGTPAGFAGTPIIKGNLIIWRDAFGLRAMDRHSRQVAWEHRTATPLYSLLSLNSDRESRRGNQSTYSRNSVLEQLTSDGQHVYLIDENFILDRGQTQFLFGGPEPNPRGEPANSPTPWNRILALQLQPGNNSDRVAWKVGGNSIDEPTAVLSGHYFLGPPLALGGLLYSVAEYQKLISLIALQPETGRVVWRQTLSFAPQPSRESPLPIEKMRLSQACFVAGSRGILVCPLGSGILVGMNQVTGEIAWIQDYRTRMRRPSFPYTPFSHNAYEQTTEGDFPNPPLIHGNRVYFLAPGDNTSDQVYCLDLQTGKKIWQVESTELKYLGMVADDLLIGIGGTDVVGFTTQLGAVKWTRRVPRISGIGAAVNGLYLLPLAEGRVLSLDPRDGSEVGFSMQVPGMRPGNLIVSGQDVVSLNGLDLQVFPQSAELLASLEARPANSRLSYNYWYELGELQFRLGQIKTAKANLTKALSMADETGIQSSIRNVLREVAWHELSQQTEQRDVILAEYAALCETPEHRAQHLLLQGEEQARNGHLVQARQTAHELLRLGVSQPLRLLADPDRQLNATVWVAEFSARSARGTAPAEQLFPGEQSADELLRKGDRDGLMRLLQQHPNASWSPRLRLELARMLVREGQTQAAELLVWRDYLNDDSVGLDASRFLLELWESAGLYEESGLLLNRLATRLSSVKGADGQTGHAIYAAYPRTSLAWSAAQRFVPLDWKVDRVRIVERHEIDQKMRSTFSTAPRYLHFPQSSQQLVVRGHTLTNVLQQIDSETGSVIANITLPSSNSTGFFPIYDTRNRIGHFLPLGGAASCYGISMLERGLAWNLDSAPQFRLNNMVRVGPCTPSVCVFRSRDRLFALDPASGQLLWERDDLEEGGRVTPNALTAIPGDAEVIVLLESDSKSYRLFKTTDGSFIRAGKLTNCFYIHHQFGRNLLYSTDQQMRNIQLWDPLTDKVVFEAGEMATSAGISERDPEFTVASSNGEVRVIDGLTGREKLQVKLNLLDFQPQQQAPTIKSFTDGTRYYINVHRQLQINSQSTYPSDAIFPTQQITGDLHAIDPATSKLLWTRPRVTTQNIVHLPDYQLPFLVSLSRWRGSFRGNSQPSLRIDVIDGQTGQVMVSKNNAFNDRLFLTDYDRNAGRLRFRGAVTQLLVEFGREVNRPDLERDEFVVHERP